MLDELKNALDATGLAFAYAAWSDSPAGDYGIYMDERSDDFTADGAHAEACTIGTVDYFTRGNGAAAKAAIEAALESVEGCAWYLNVVLYEEDTGYQHFEWLFEVV